MEKIRMCYTKYLRKQGIGQDIIDKSFYVIESSLFEVVKFFILFLIFYFQGKIIPFLVALLSIALVRTNLGGIHFSSQKSCLCASVVIFHIILFLGEQIRFSNMQGLIICVIASGVMLAKAPIPSMQRPQYSEKQKKKFKMKGILMLALLCSISMLYSQWSSYILWAIIIQQIEAVWVVKIF